MANLGVALASVGHRVVLFDADPGTGQIWTLFWVSRPISTSSRCSEGNVQMSECAVTGPAGVRLITGSSGVGAMLRLSRKRLTALLSRTAELADTTDFLIYDCASGADPRVMTFLMTADQVILVTTYDPASLVDCYSTAKVLFRSDMMLRSASSSIALRVRSLLKGPSIPYGPRPRSSCTSRSLTWARSAKIAAYRISAKRKPFVISNPGLAASKDLMRLADSLAGSSCSLREHRASHLEDEKAA